MPVFSLYFLHSLFCVILFPTSFHENFFSLLFLVSCSACGDRTVISPILSELAFFPDGFICFNFRVFPTGAFWCVLVYLLSFSFFSERRRPQVDVPLIFVEFANFLIYLHALWSNWT